ncbi:putative cytochrome P450 E-class, group IV [Echria macrotheca]|uniref:Cytochrome P450 E-class, group IV n=1 Tax=Echria macrotheca TaxID=438768 RepID=A0AAJ0F7Y7_9PEZI|nr:putative cytochrome P450 E-class, group IV [Echria macrotheca]
MADIQQGVLHLVQDKLPLVLSTAAVFVAVILFQTFLAKNPLDAIPEVGTELGSNEKRRQAFLFNSRALYTEGYQKFKDGVFRIVTSRSKSPVVVVAPKYLAELKKLPDDVLSFDGAIEESMHAKYTLLDVGNPAIPHTVKASLTPALPRLSPALSDEVRLSFLSELPPCEGWTPIRINQKLLRIVAMVSGRIFIGSELCRDEEYLDAAISYTIELTQARGAVDKLAPWKRPFLASRLPEVRRVAERFKQADAFLRPVVEARKKLGPDEKPDDMLQWVMDNQGRFGDDSSAKLARLQLGLSFAAIHTTTMTATNAFYNLAAHPEITTDLRSEIRDVLAAHDGVMSAPALQAMKKVDSFLKETLRFDPPGVASFQRKVLRQFTLSSGQTIPAGVVIEVPSMAISRDAAIFPDPERFDHLRFYKLRQDARERGEAETAAQNQFVSVSQSSLTFGYGRHACPGRFLAANEIKMIVATAVLLYDMRLVDGVTERYPNLVFGSTSVPDPTKEVLFKRVAE